MSFLSDKPSTSTSAKLVIALDFGTTNSGVAYSDNNSSSTQITVNYNWPGSIIAQAPHYCKTLTSLFYTPSPTKSGHFELRNWGWPALTAFNTAIVDFERKNQRRAKSPTSSQASSSQSVTSANVWEISAEEIATNIGYYTQNFKLYLAPETKQTAPLAQYFGDLNPERFAVDYLRSFTDFIIGELRVGIRNDLSLRDLQWCLTVPAIWDEGAKQKMRKYAEKAGMITGSDCPTNDSASPYPLQIILESEAAAAYCETQARRRLNLKRGDRILIADVGGGTIDLAVHEICKVDGEEGPIEVKEAASSYGGLGGGAFLDMRFLEVVSKKIPCFNDFWRNVNPSIGPLLLSWWQRWKVGFDGKNYSADFSLLASGLTNAWMQYDRSRGIQNPDSHYMDLHLSNEDFKNIFDPEINKVLNLIEEQICNVRILMVVGGFAGSLYLREKIFRTFDRDVDQIIIPDEPGKAICHGAVLIHLKKLRISSRISRRSYGICTIRNAEEDDPVDLIIKGEDGKSKCTMVFSVFVRAGEQVLTGSTIKRIFNPTFRKQKSIRIDLYSSTKRYPKYTNEAEAQLEGRFMIDISKGMIGGRRREIEVTMTFGDSLISVSARGKSGWKTAQNSLIVRFDYK
ncbi:hypothetical protein KP509_31G045500 [Ceratopteris richardii]|uniref:Uncharacterized protein n=1 Tax=Ceratopteris richardii TaxID=49495 RepID=A0A8T2QZS5_CERRI|nr:hypothetical protein KP509_31G045500 [Ceratopteris richardii]